MGKIGIILGKIDLAHKLRILSQKKHLKASCVVSSVTVIIENGRPVLGTWQGIYFCEFYGPRSRKFYVKIQ